MGEVRDRWRADMDVYRSGTGNACGNATLALRILVMPRLQAVTLFRVSEWLHVSGRKNAAMVVKGVNQVITGADITPSARIEGGLQLFHPQGVVIGPGRRHRQAGPHHLRCGDRQGSQAAPRAAQRTRRHR